MRGKSQRDSTFLELLAPPGEYGESDNLLNMISAPNFMGICSAIQAIWLLAYCYKTTKMTYPMPITVNRSPLLFI